MRKSILMALSRTVLLGVFLAAQALPCTSIMVGRRASTDGSVMTSHTCDSHRTGSEIVVVPHAKHAAGAERELSKRCDDDTRPDAALRADAHGQDPAGRRDVCVSGAGVRLYERAPAGHRRIDVRGPRGTAERQGLDRLRDADAADAGTGRDRPRGDPHRRRVAAAVRLVRLGRSPDHRRPAGGLGDGDHRARQGPGRGRLGGSARSGRPRLGGRQLVADRRDRSGQAGFLPGLGQRHPSRPASAATGTRTAAARFGSTKRTIPTAGRATPARAASGACWTCSRLRSSCTPTATCFRFRSSRTRRSGRRRSWSCSATRSRARTSTWSRTSRSRARTARRSRVPWPIPSCRTR